MLPGHGEVYSVAGAPETLLEGETFAAHRITALWDALPRHDLIKDNEVEGEEGGATRGFGKQPGTPKGLCLGDGEEG